MENRLIKFRGKYSGGGIENRDKWIYGTPIYGDKKTYINKGGRLYAALEVDPKTVGEFTGLLDKKGVEIYEGDILKQMTTIVTVKFRYGCFFFCTSDDNEFAQNPFATDFHHTIKQYQDRGISVDDKFIHMEVIGNIFQNKNLLNEKQ